MYPLPRVDRKVLGNTVPKADLALIKSVRLYLISLSELLAASQGDYSLGGSQVGWVENMVMAANHNFLGSCFTINMTKFYPEPVGSEYGG